MMRGLFVQRSQDGMIKCSCIAYNSLSMLVLSLICMLVSWSIPSRAADANASWNSKTASAYLDQRTTLWMHNGGAMNHETFCISCHTALPYALAQSALHEQEPTPLESHILSSVTKRVQLWTEDQQYLNNKDQGPGTESVLNVMVLVNYDSRNHKLNQITQQALKIMWAQQLKNGPNAGAWPWFNYGNEPWEAQDSQYWGAALAAVAVGTLPPAYRFDPDIQDNLRLLKEYLAHNQQDQSLQNRLTLLWASTKWQGLLNADRKAEIVHAVMAKQHPDGGWSASDLIPSTWKRSDGTPQETKSDGYATGFVTFVIEQAGIPRTQSAIKAGRLWLIRNQDKATGSWPAYSLNKKRDPTSDAGRFMSDAATGYAILALTTK
jgi:squalene-hopene/tetraprenyl-beta-curcumene cyclase